MYVTSSEGLRAKRFRTWRSILALILREMSTTYGRSPGGYLWAILEPALAIAVLSAAFEFVFRQPSLGTNFPFYFATGFLPFSLALTNMGNTARAIRFSRSLLAYPGVTWSDAIIARVILGTLTEVMVGILVISGIILVFDIHTMVRPMDVLNSIGMAIAFGTGLGSMNCYLFTTFPLWERVYSVLTRPLILISGVIFLYDSLPRTLLNILWYNPFVHIVGQMRRGFFPSYDAPYLSPAYVYAVSLILGSFGFLLLYRHHKALLNM